MGTENDLRVFDNADEQRYELWVGDDRAGFVEYRMRPDTIWLIHTEVDSAFEGRGLGSRLVAGTLGDIRARELKLVPICPFVRAFLRKHREYDDLVVPPAAVGE